MPANRGRIVVEHNNTETLRFWIRVFELEPQIAFARARFDQQSAEALTKGNLEHDPLWGMVPIISEYDAGHIKWFYCLVFEFDAIDISGGTGIIFYADKAHEGQAREFRDRFANSVLEATQARTKKGLWSEMYLTEPGAQK